MKFCIRFPAILNKLISTVRVPPVDREKTFFPPSGKPVLTKLKCDRLSAESFCTCNMFFISDEFIFSEIYCPVIDITEHMW